MDRGDEGLPEEDPLFPDYVLQDFPTALPAGSTSSLAPLVWVASTFDVKTSFSGRVQSGTIPPQSTTLDTTKVSWKLWNVGVVGLMVLTVWKAGISLFSSGDECRTGGGDDAGRSLPGPAPALPPLLLDPDPPPSINASNVFRVSPHLGRWDNKRILRMTDNALVGSHFLQLSSRYSVCLATQSSLEKLHSIVQVANHWGGPISAALFAAGDEEYRLLQSYVAYLRECHPAVRQRVAFHLAFPADRLPKSLGEGGGQQAGQDRRRPGRREEDKGRCERPEPALQALLSQRSPELLKWRQRNPYPQNHLRNLARKNCQSSKVFLTDIDIIPSHGMAEGLEGFITRETCPNLCAYVIPTYELDERVPFPKNKSELVRLSKNSLARPFHHKVFIYNQFATNFSRWEQDFNYNGVHISHRVTNFEFLYEPFYVAPDIVPPHDERFIGYGFTRNTQVYEMFVAGYQFYVLSPVFTIHWGLQQRKGRPPWRERQNTNNRKNFDQFKREVFAKYHKDPLNMVLHHSKDSQRKI